MAREIGGERSEDGTVAIGGAAYWAGDGEDSKARQRQHEDEARSSLLSSYDTTINVDAPLDRLLHHADPCPQSPRYCTGCSSFRIMMAPMSGLVFGLTGLTYYAYVFQTPDASLFELGGFHICLALMLTSYLQCVLLDPGTVPRRWHNAVLHSPSRDRFRICHKCDMYKPPRAHFDSITQRLVLNMDHFCPWVVNCVGFYNRKFFILFLFYTVVSCLWFLIATLCRGMSIQKLLISHHGTTAIKFMAVVFDSSLALAVSGFTCFHVKLVYYNQTTIESECDEYDVGWRRNVESVFGANPYLWLVPVVGGGPVGDGVHWPLSDGTVEGGEDLVPVPGSSDDEYYEEEEEREREQEQERERRRMAGSEALGGERERVDGVYERAGIQLQPRGSAVSKSDV